MKRNPIKTTYDSYNNEAITIITPNLFTGIRTEISKSILPFCQLSTIKTSNAMQTFLTLNSKNTVFQFSFDNARNYQFKSSFLSGPIITKLHSIVSHKKETFNQLEAILNSKFYNLCFKLISPTFDASNLIYILSYCATLKFVTFGTEIVSANKELGMSFSTRIDAENSIYCANLERFNTLTLSFYQKLRNLIEIGAEFKKSRDNISYSIGSRVKNQRSEVKTSIDSNYNIYFGWIESLTENLRIEFSSLSNWDEFDYGIGITFES
ncbi:hypothetical protein GINT2_000828 [Glugoides intestinalis]